MKSEDQTEKDKEAVQKMIGAKSAMEAALRRIAILENAIDTMNVYLNKLAQGVGNEVGVKTSLSYGGTSAGDSRFVGLKNHIEAIASIGIKAR